MCATFWRMSTTAYTMARFTKFTSESNNSLALCLYSMSEPWSEWAIGAESAQEMLNLTLIAF
jgi:hypothetical protein